MEKEKFISEEHSIERALRLMGQKGDLTDEELREVLQDKETMEMVADMDLLKKGLERHHVAIPDPEREWKRFSVGKDKRKFFRNKSFWTGLVSGIAASFIIVMGVVWAMRSEDDPTMLLASTPLDEVEQVTLETEEGESIVFSKEGFDGTGDFQQTDTATISYDVEKGIKDLSHHTLRTPRGQAFKVILADGTAVWLNAESKLEYPTKFIGEERCVKLTGEAYFEVKSDREHPFVVITEDLRTRVLGTEFNVCNYLSVKPNVTLVQGSVEVMNINGKDAIKIKPGTKATLQKNGSFKVQKVDTDIYKYWKEGYFYFDNEQLSTIMQKIGLWYNVDVKFVNPNAMNYRMHYFCNRSEDIKEVIEQLNMLKKVKAAYRDNIIYIE